MSKGTRLLVGALVGVAVGVLTGAAAGQLRNRGLNSVSTVLLVATPAIIGAIVATLLGSKQR